MTEYDQVEIDQDQILDELNREIIEDINFDQDLRNIAVSSKDWTVETIYSQVRNSNIDLNPRFQRRNAWSDTKRSSLIESLILGIPVPEIILAEDTFKPRAYIVIDGKQRLLTLAGFINPAEITYWSRPVLQDLKVLKQLNGKSYDDLEKDPELVAFKRAFLNADVRTTLISNYKNTDILYDIFHRINTGSVPLSPQELRQALHKGPFADYLVDVTNTLQPLHLVLGLTAPDRRLVDVEIILRYIAFEIFGKNYKGNLKNFLDDNMGEINNNWADYEEKVKEIYADFSSSIDFLQSIFPERRVGRRFKENRWEGRFNKVLFEVETYYFVRVLRVKPSPSQAENQAFLEQFQALSNENREFQDSVATSTKNLDAYRTRFQLFREIVNSAYNLEILDIPVEV